MPPDLARRLDAQLDAVRMRPPVLPSLIPLLIFTVGVGVGWWILGGPLGWGWLALRILGGGVLSFLWTRFYIRRWYRRHPVDIPALARQAVEDWHRERRDAAPMN